MVLTKRVNISFVSTYVPRQCGIATFTNSLAASIGALIGEKESDNSAIKIAALTNINDGYKYGSEVLFEIKEQNKEDYREAAYYLNLSDADVVSIQHEFGIFGGEWGSNVLILLNHLRKPLVTTFHTVLKEPSEEQMKIVKEIANYSTFLVVLSQRAVKLLEKIYGIPKSKIFVIPHGAPDVPFIDPAYYKDKFQLSNKKVILTFGLLSPGKGIEEVLKSLPEVVKKYSDFTYIILGATHPNIKRQFGEAYRGSLENLASELGLSSNILFLNRFVSNAELLEFLLMSDIYISPYLNKEQIVSGTLTYALACGKAIISTPYWHAEEVLSDERGVLVPFRHTKSMKNAIMSLLGDETLRNKYRKRAYELGREMIWSKVGASYLDLFLRAMDSYRFKRTVSRAKIWSKTKGSLELPEVKLDHIYTLTDSTGILQHATYNIPNRNEGYTTDDNARALVVTLLNWLIYKDSEVFKLLNIYTSFLLYAYNQETNSFRNFMSYSRCWIEDTGSDDSNGRVLFALGYMVKNPPSDSYLNIAKTLFEKVIISNASKIKSPRALAWMLMGCIFYLQRFSGAREIRQICKTIADTLHSLYIQNKSADWLWLEDIVTYSNGRIPQSLIMAGSFFRNKNYSQAGIEMIDWLYKIQYDEKEHCLSLIGNEHWYKRNGQKSRYDQQPVEIPGLIDACYQAYRTTDDKKWLDRIRTSFNWFLGNNIRNEVLYDYSTGGCYDGLSSSVSNMNQGAEATLSWLTALHRMIRIEEELQLK